MIALLMFYGLVVGVLFAAAAWVLERALRLQAQPMRWIWMVTLFATALLVGTAPVRRAPVAAVVPLTAATGADIESAAVGDAARGILSGLQDLFAATFAPIDAPLRKLEAISSDSRQRLDWILAPGWMAVSGVLLLLFGATVLRSSRERRRWPKRRLHGTTLRVAPAAGPMVAGVLHPEVVVPEWLLHAPEDEQRLVLAHEGEHVRRRDPLLLAGGALLVVLLPWNPAVWWMAARLRLAVEVDCDRRVLRGGASRTDYGSTLLQVATRRTRGFFPAPTLLESSSQLERRLTMMTPKSSRFAGVRSIGLAALAGALALTACDRSLPSAPEIERMDVAAAEAGAQKVGVTALSDGPNTVFTIDGREVSADEARALDASRIASIDIRGAGSDGETKTSRAIHIWTPQGLKARGVEGPKRGARMRIVSSEEGPAENSPPTRVVVRGGEGLVDGKKVEIRKFEGLFVINGKIEDQSSMRKLDPESIESIEVVKGPAASQLYSDPAAKNGVILITTKAAAGPSR